MARQKHDDQLERTYSSCVRIRDVTLKTCQRRWTIGKSGERGSGISVLAARHEDDDDNCASIRMALVWFYGISTIVGYLMLNPLYAYILNLYDLVWLSFMAYQPL